MQTEKIDRLALQLHRLTMIASALSVLALVLMILNLGYELVVVFGLTDCQFG